MYIQDPIRRDQRPSLSQEDRPTWMAPKGTKPTLNCSPASVIQVISGFSLFVIGCMAAAGTFPHSTAALGRTVVALGAVSGTLHLFLKLATPDKQKKDWAEIAISLIMTIGAITAGALGMHGMANMKQIGWAVIGPLVASLGLVVPLACCACCCIAAAKRSAPDDFEIPMRQQYG